MAVANSPQYYSRSDLHLRDEANGAKYWAVTLDRTMLTYFEVPALCRFVTHQHVSEQITMVLEGTLFLEFNGQVKPVSANEVIAIPANVPHAVYTELMSVKAIDVWSPVLPTYRS